MVQKGQSSYNYSATSRTTDTCGAVFGRKGEAIKGTGGSNRKSLFSTPALPISRKTA